ncbi:polyprenyl synthetase family protein [Bradymonas sediminis]|nr:polyprenyl synthetase family protein [Bradymonas sediminis]TDP62700.1 farnesyl-diphosphate synthase /geranylgeranyl-diphosphate synthase [Bradymonas sediminis]
MSELLTHLDNLRETHLPQIRSLLDAVVAEESPEDSSLAKMCTYHMDTGGKRLRALLPLAVGEALGVEPEKLVPFGAACEMLHNATLVHDDLQDGDRVRRGKPTIWVEFGEARAINLGDAMFYWALLILMRMDCDIERREALSKRLLSESLRVIDGQDREFLLKDLKTPTIEDYFAMVEGKTSGLFALPVAGAAEFCGAPAEVVKALEASAGHLGVLFQIQDDVLDLYADKGREHVGTDICEGKISALVVHFLANAAAAERDWLRGVLEAERDAVSHDDIDRAARAFREVGSLQFALDEIERRRALACDAPIFADYPDLKALLNAMADIFLEPISPLLDASA